MRVARGPRKEPETERGEQAAQPAARDGVGRIVALQRSAGNAAVATALLARDATALPPLPAVKRFKDLWPEFSRATTELRPDGATALAKRLVDAPYDFDDVLNHGIEVVDWLQRHGEPAFARRMLDELRTVWMVQSVTKDATLPTQRSLTWSQSDPATLIKLGAEAAR